MLLDLRRHQGRTGLHERRDDLGPPLRRLQADSRAEVRRDILAACIRGSPTATENKPMAHPRRNETDGKWDDKLMCHIMSLSYDFRTREGKIYFPEGECCDRNWCVALFIGIDPAVLLIRTYSGDEPDTAYR